MLNAVLTYISEAPQKFAHLGNPETFSSVVATPRFKASGHLIFFIFSPKQHEPVLIAKIPRIPGDNIRLDREVENLRSIESLKAGGFDSIPLVLAYEAYHGTHILLETAAPGQIMRPTFVRQHRVLCLETLLSWLIDLHRLSSKPTATSNGWFENLVERPLQKLAQSIPATDSELLVARTMKIAKGIQQQHFPLVFEHGDLSSPNVLIANKRQLGVVDWELAEAEGLPAVDLFFFLTYVAFSLQRAKTNEDYKKGFRKAFFGQDAWAKKYVKDYQEQLQLSDEVLGPLFVLCWSRYVAGLVERLENEDNLEQNVVDWLLSNRYYLLWRYTIENFNHLNLK